MLRTWLLLALLLANAAWGQAPVYSADSMVNGSNYAPGPFAPNSIVSIFGSGLAWSSQGVTAADIVNNTLPTALNGTQVLVGVGEGGGTRRRCCMSRTPRSISWFPATNSTGM